MGPHRIGFSGNRMPVSINAVYNANDKGPNKAYDLGYTGVPITTSALSRSLGGTTYYRWRTRTALPPLFL